MLAGACLARSGLARRALDTNFSFNLGWYFEYFSKSDNSKQLVPVRNLYSKILRICWFQGKSNWTFRFWEIQWLHPVHEEKNFDEILIFWSFIFECLYGSGVSQGSSWWVPGGSEALKKWLVKLCLKSNYASWGRSGQDSTSNKKGRTFQKMQVLGKDWICMKNLTIQIAQARDQITNTYQREFLHSRDVQIIPR